MNLEDKYKPRSDKSREESMSPESKDIKKVTDGEFQAPSKARSIGSLFFKSDPRSVGDSIIEDVILPGINDMISDGLHSAIDMFFVGGRRSRSSSRYRDSNSRVSYNRYYDDDRGSRNRRYDEPPKRSYTRPGHVENIVVDQRWQAEEIIDEMRGTLTEYDFVSVADVYRMIGKDYEWTATKWGWRNIGSTNIEKLRGGGYEIILPAPEKY